MPTGTPISQTVIHKTMDWRVQGVSKSEIARRLGTCRFTIIKIIDAYAVAQRIDECKRTKALADQSRHDALVDSDP